MAKDVAVAGDSMLLKQSVLHDPLFAAISEPEEIWQMVDQMLVAQRQWLPNYAAANIDVAEQCLADHNAAGTRVSRPNWNGAARQAVRSVETPRRRSRRHPQR
jgi:alpha-galactosidase